ncbi:hypothetical protein [Stenotrophomonas sp.]|uniref:hypothetical protein n=1 Tax=Stenotrophomonas sp. TaxID=69392 RepID=UPI0028A887BC|nr:hypothetical protein [Stenotrophomonas sp.]
MRRIAIGLGMMVSVLAAPAAAMTFMKVDYVCPVGGERFSARTMGSGTSFGHFLDGRAYGAIKSPWPLVQCPGNGFVMFRETFSADEVRALDAYVQGEEYRRMRESETSYWLVSRLMQAIDAPADEQAGVLQRATWQASPAQYPRYVAAAAAAFAEQCPDQRPAARRDQRWLHCQMILGEWERRLSRFDAARARFTGLQPQVEALVVGEDSQRSARQFRAEIAQQLQLIEQGDNADTVAVDANAPAHRSAEAAAQESAAAAQAAAQAADAAAAAGGRRD